MRTLIIICAIQFSLLFQGLAQSNYQQFYNQYGDAEGVVTLSIPTMLVKLMLDEEERAEAGPLFDKVDKISFLAADDTSQEVLNKFKKSMPSASYKDLMEMKDGGSTVLFKVKEVGDGIEELLMTGEDDGSFFVLCLIGSFTWEDASELARSIQNKDIKGLAN